MNENTIDLAAHVFRTLAGPPQKYHGIRYQCPKCDTMYAYRCRCDCGAMVERIKEGDRKE